MALHRFSAEEILMCRRSLLAWYDANKRKLPWRDWHDTDSNIVAYRGCWEKRDAQSMQRSFLPTFIVLVSELMLQQTQVATVIRYYNTWMEVERVRA